MSTICLIAAAAEDNALGKNNDLLWHLPDDFKRFKKLTTGHPMIMGRKTFESFPKPLPNREHIVITRDPSYKIQHESCTVVHSMEAALEATKESPLTYIIGGGEIYRLGEPWSNQIELTRVHATFEDADTFFPDIDESVWKLTNDEFHPVDDRHAYAFTYLTYERR